MLASDAQARRRRPKREEAPDPARRPTPSHPDEVPAPPNPTFDARPIEGSGVEGSVVGGSVVEGSVVGGDPQSRVATASLKVADGRMTASARRGSGW
jgi:hypothetical protein